MVPSDDEPYCVCDHEHEEPVHPVVEHDVAEKLDAAAAAAERGCSVCQGPPHRLCVAWAVSADGSEYVGLLLWIGKDWSWSQLGWTAPAFVFGTGALLWLVGSVLVSCRRRLRSEVYKGVVLCLWLSGLYAWMAGEFWTLWYTTEDLGHHAYVYEQWGNNVAKWVLIGSTVLYAVFFAVLVPRDVFASDRQSLLLQRLEATNPPCPRWTVGCLRDYRTYSSLHFFTWTIKDTLWAWDLPRAYAVAFLITVLLNLDLLWRLGTHKGLYVDFINYLVILFWVLANGLWAFGEMIANSEATDDQFRRYSWPQWHMIRGTSFEYRYAAGWMFLVSGLCLLAFYLHWMVRTVQGGLPGYDKTEQGSKVALRNGEIPLLNLV